MTNAVITSVIARCLLDAAFSERMAADTRMALGEYVLDDRTRAELETLDVVRVRSFAGFIAKVQHNFLWESFPWTIKLLKVYGIELEIFTSYLARHQRLRETPRISNREKTSAFIAYLRGLLQDGLPTLLPGLLDVLTHEQAEWEIRSALANEPFLRPFSYASPASSSREFLRQVPLVRGMLRVAQFSCDPCEIISLLEVECSNLDRLVPQPKYLAYWGDVATQELRVLEFDPVSAALLAQVNGRRSLRTILRRGCVGLPKTPRLPAVRQLFRLLTEHGLLAFEGGRS